MSSLSSHILLTFASFEDQFRELAYSDSFFGKIDMTENHNCFAWCFWEFEFPMTKLRQIGSIAVRATDDALASQGRDMVCLPYLFTKCVSLAAFSIGMRLG
jgi:hypothetical protein